MKRLKRWRRLYSGLRVLTTDSVLNMNKRRLVGGTLVLAQAKQQSFENASTTVVI